jgi:hypothetical protein
MKKITFIVCASLMLFSCGKKSTKDKLIGKWRGVLQENPEMEMMHKQGLAFLDTVGKNTTPEQNKELYGTDDITAFKEREMRAMDSFIKSQDAYTKATVIEFRKDGIAVFNFNGDVDSANWYMDDEGALIFDEMKLKGSGEKLTMQIDHISDTALKLKFNEQDFMGAVTFHPEK